MSEDAIYILSTDVNFVNSPITYTQALYKVLYGKVIGKITIKTKNSVSFDVAYVKNGRLILIDKLKKVSKKIIFDNFEKIELWSNLKKNKVVAKFLEK